MTSYLATFSILSSQHSKIKSFMERWLAVEDIESAHQKQSDKQQYHFLIARALLRALLYHDTPSEEWKIFNAPNGKPYIINKQGHQGPHISISHTHGMVACAISSHTAIGIDIEYWRERNFLKLAEYAFGPQEQQAVKEHGISEFYRIWTLREAMGKATGEGLKFVTNGLDLVVSSIEEYHRLEDFYLYQHKGEPKNYNIALALYNLPKNLIAKTVDFIDSEILLSSMLSK